MQTATPKPAGCCTTPPVATLMSLQNDTNKDWIVKHKDIQVILNEEENDYVIMHAVGLATNVEIYADPNRRQYQGTLADLHKDNQ